MRKIQEARDGGMSVLDIMRKFNVAEQTVYKQTKKRRLDGPNVQTLRTADIGEAVTWPLR